jgi:RimJ/RimL family protein N-acetyltransferase
MKLEQRNSTDRQIIIRPSKEAEFEMYYRVRCEPSDYTWMGFAGKPDRENLRNIFLQRLGTVDLSIVNTKIIFLAHLRNCGIAEQDDVIGFIQLSHNSDGMEIGYSVMEKYQGLGIGTELIHQSLNIARRYSDIVYAQIRDDNIASQKAVLKNGFIRTDEYVVVDWLHHGRENFRKYELRM